MLQVTYKSEEVVPEDLQEPVKVVKGKSFEEIVSGMGSCAACCVRWCRRGRREEVVGLREYGWWGR